MGAMSLAEPAVLANAKEYLLGDVDNGYAVVDAQFGQETWGDEGIPDAIQRRLRPINSLSMNNGYPDALVAPPHPGAYRVGENAALESVPLAVIEAKGDTNHSNRNAGRVAITQAHAHLEEVNVGYAALPQSHVSERERALARELNIGLLAVDGTGTELLERPRVVGADASATTDTIRFHARLGGITVENIQKNHPKNALGYALAVAAAEETDAIFREYVIESVDDARLDATALGLVGDRLNRRELTALGREAVRTITYHHGDVLSALNAIQKQTGSPARFIEETPVMGTVTRQALLAYPPTQVLVNTLDDLAESGVRRPSLAQVAKAVATERPDFALDLFINSKSRAAVLNDADGKRRVSLDAFEKGSVYSTHTTFQYKALLYHVGILTSRGNDTKSELDPTEAVWALEDPVTRSVGE
ncbi:hypothetical protein PNQ29_08435 [Halobacterium salinarum]|uniref:hypothetical protein n=1 Tax=Halobacterium salinarum TaxID=2242 RepID=UPI00255749EA|nr:hypothetical protein [Halobacterium salinarum]MDL0118279.1 hypothetical protein [Halobacterium salinarum]MDL0119756.1 hypothetical protein [Halobacterium salinarum]